MPNMSYCRFENTVGDLEDCYGALEEKGVEGLSESERSHALKLIVLCSNLSDDFHRILTEDVSVEDAADAGA